MIILFFIVSYIFMGLAIAIVIAKNLKNSSNSLGVIICWPPILLIFGFFWLGEAIDDLVWWAAK